MIEPTYRDTSGRLRRLSPEVRSRIEKVLGRPLKHEVLVVEKGSALRVSSPAEVITEDSATIPITGGRLPSDLPYGYHRLHPLKEDRAIPLIVTPRKCHLPEGLREWGWAVQLYALRSKESWGMGDLADLRRLASWSKRGGAGFVLLNPLHAPAPTLPQDPSPYFPSSRMFRNPLYLRVEEVPGASQVANDLESLARRGRDLNKVRLIDRDSIFRLKMQALERLWKKWTPDPRFEEYLEEQGGLLEQFATFCALSEQHGPQWPDWPATLQDKDSTKVGEFREKHSSRVRFFCWLQWLLSEQLRRAGEGIPVIGDLAIGADPAGADTWMWPEAFAHGVQVGAPPDAFAAHGQNWGLAPLNPYRLRALDYEPFIRTLRSCMVAGGGLRIDHVMGLFRLFWIPMGLGPGDGAYVRYPADDLLRILALESHRAGAFVIGEDLGTVPAGLRRRMGARDILSQKLLYFESRPRERYPRKALASVTTHDLPTFPGLWTGADVDAQRKIEGAPNIEETLRLKKRVARRLDSSEDASIEEVVARAYKELGESPSMLVSATLEDALGVQERPNMPGTTTQYPNWALALPSTLEQIIRRSRVRELTETLEGARSRPR